LEQIAFKLLAILPKLNINSNKIKKKFQFIIGYQYQPFIGILLSTAPPLAASGIIWHERLPAL